MDIEPGKWSVRMDGELGQRPLRRQVFIFTLWQEGGALTNAPPVWRCRLEDPHTAVRRGFKNVAELAAFLVEWTAVPPEESRMDE